MTDDADKLLSEIIKANMLNAFNANLNIDIISMSLEELNRYLFRKRRLINNPLFEYSPKEVRKGVLLLHLFQLNPSEKDLDYTQKTSADVITRAFGGQPVWNYDGRAFINRGTKSLVSLQLFQNGTLESIITGIIQDHNHLEIIGTEHLKGKIIDYLMSMCEVAKEIGLVYPLIFSITIAGCKGARLFNGQEDYDAYDIVPKFELNDYLFPEIILDGKCIENIELSIRSLLALIWRSGGHRYK